jgi:hypothetical protein
MTDTPKPNFKNTLEHIRKVQLELEYIARAGFSDSDRLVYYALDDIVFRALRYFERRAEQQQKGTE